jgi:hypothetical protein
MLQVGPALTANHRRGSRSRFGDRLNKSERLRSSDLCCGTVADKQYGDVIRLASAAGKGLDRFQNFILELLQWNVMLAGKHFSEASDSEKLVVRVHRFRDAIGEENQRVSRAKMFGFSRVICFGN